MLFLVAFLCCISLFFEMTICSGGSEEIKCREITFKEHPIGYLDAVNKKYSLFDRRYKSFDVTYEEVISIREFHENSTDLPGIIREDNKLVCLSDNRSVGYIAWFLENTNLDVQPKKVISDMLKDSVSLQYRLSYYEQAVFSRKTLILVSRFITAICKEQKNSHLVIDRDAAKLLLDDFKKQCDDVYYSQGTKKRDIFFTLSFCALLIIGLCNEYKYQLNSNINKHFSLISFITVGYGVFIVYDTINSYLCFEEAFGQYTSTYDTLIKEKYFSDPSTSFAMALSDLVIKE